MRMLILQIFEIIGIVYQYNKLLREVSPQEWIFSELQDIGNIEFRFAEEQPHDDYASELAVNLQLHAAEHVILGNNVFKIWDEELIEYILGFLRPENMRIDVVSSSFKSGDFQCEPWFGSHYNKEDISQSSMDLWKDPPEIDVALHLPAKNEFIPCDFSIRSDVLCLDVANISSPRCILDEPLMKLWYNLDITFKVSRVNTYFCFNLKSGYDYVKSSVLTQLYIDLLKDELSEMVYQASLANLGTSLSVFIEKLQLEVCGFNDKLPALLSKKLETMNNFLPSYDRFKRGWCPLFPSILRFNFDSAYRLVCLSQKEDVIDFYKTYVQESSPKRRRLAIRIWGCNTDFKEAEACMTRVSASL